MAVGTPKANGRPAAGPRQLYIPDVPLNPSNFGAAMQTRYRHASGVDQGQALCGRSAAHIVVHNVILVFDRI